MLALLIVGVVFLAISYPLLKILEKKNCRWSNLVFVICLAIGILSLGVFAGI